MWQRENEYLKQLGWNDEQVAKMSSWVPSPMTEGATSKWSIELAEEA